MCRRFKVIIIALVIACKNRACGHKNLTSFSNFTFMMTHNFLIMMMIMKFRV